MLFEKPKGRGRELKMKIRTEQGLVQFVIPAIAMAVVAIEK
jgi:hypothetical protein